MTTAVSKRVLVIRAGQLGDTVFASSIIEPLRHMYGEDVVIHWVAKAGMHTLFDADPRIGRVFALKSRRAPLLLSPPKRAVVRESWRAPYDLVVNLELGTIFDSMVRLVRARKKVGMPYRYFTEPAETHAVENLHLIYRSFMDKSALRLATPSLIGPSTTEILAKHGLQKPYILLHPTTSHFDKSDYRNYRSWPVEYWRELISRLGAGGSNQIVLLGARGEEPYFEQFGELPSHVLSLVGKTSLPELISVIAGAAALITTDTGPSHIAAAVNTPVFAVFGPSNYHKTGPYPTPANNVHILTANLPCSPCSLTGAIRQCPRNRCMYDVTPERVLAELNR